MSASVAGGGGPGPGSGAGSGPSNPRKFSEKIALHTQRQAEETAAFQEVMMDITSTRLQAQKLRLTHGQGHYYGGSLPNVNQIGSSLSEFQVGPRGTFSSSLDVTRGTRHRGLVERVQRERRLISPLRHYRRQIDSSPYSSAYLSPPADASWRRNFWPGNIPTDKGQLFRLPSAALNRTNSDSALHTSVMNPNSHDPFNQGIGFQHRSGLADGDCGRMFPYPVPPIEENILDDTKPLLKSWDAKNLPMLSSRPKSCEVPGINIFPSPDQQPSSPHIPSALNTGGSLPDLTSLHFPSPLPTPLDADEPSFPNLSGGNSTGNLASTLTHLGIGMNNTFSSQALSIPLQSNSSLQSSLSNPNLQASLGNKPFQTTSLHSSLSNPSLLSSRSSSSSQLSALGNQSRHSSMSSTSLRTSLSNSSIGSHPLQTSTNNSSVDSTASTYTSLMMTGPVQSQASLQQQSAVPSSLSTSPRRRAQLSPLVLPMGGDSRRHHSKQFSPTISPTLSSITQGVPLDTSKQPMDQRLPPYSYSQAHKPLAVHQQQQGGQQGHPTPLQPVQPVLPNPHTSQPVQQPSQLPQSFQQSHKTFPQEQQQLVNVQLGPQNQHLNDHQQHSQDHQQHLQPMFEILPPSSQFNQCVTDLNMYNDSSLLGSLLDDPYMNLQEGVPQEQSLTHQLEQFNMVERLAFRNNHHQLQRDLTDLAFSHPSECSHGDQQDSPFFTKQKQSCLEGRLGNVSNIIYTGDSPPGLSKEITSALASVPGFEGVTFPLDEDLEGFNMLSDADLMLSDTSVEDSLRSDRLK
ncbi:CREB-regulated transcription coactivator 2-like isoform X2 [Erpetoichthys calabaricus]|uniref:CREB regulated transcription coactivator 2 n=1 Tax=Erpetoichthys calabaricus TaxID=27687 RepID=A0A8C4RQ91_ERPCA|nr:CREB-regulated transcription coactivator 2-like isoform X1 [Erpetoichthys calabaricus]XP_051778764.1 CREB-regulated transcription coactivator 2-like isoform X2 [Erpetoichthys calabaricus]